jgi:hypothetical protein
MRVRVIDVGENGAATLLRKGIGRDIREGGVLKRTGYTGSVPVIPDPPKRML